MASGFRKEKKTGSFSGFEIHENQANVSGEPGFGLGLYISREIVTLHGGFMKAKRKEQGLEVAIFLPV